MFIERESDGKKQTLFSEFPGKGQMRQNPAWVDVQCTVVMQESPELEAVTVTFRESEGDKQRKSTSIARLD